MLRLTIEVQEFIDTVKIIAGQNNYENDNKQPGLQRLEEQQEIGKAFQTTLKLCKKDGE